MYIDAQILHALAPNGNAEIIAALVVPLNTYLPQYGINTPLRVAHFLAQALEETDGLKTLHEYASGRAYEGRKNLGNTQPGDGPRFKGRGVFDVTGRENYAFYGPLIGVDLVKNPEAAADPVNAVKLACIYWTRNGLNTWADKDDVRHVTYLINGGYNGLAQRTAYLKLAKLELGVAQAQAAPIPAVEPVDFRDPAPAIPQGPISPAPEVPLWRDPSILMAGSSAVPGIGMAIGGVTGPLAWALAVVIVALVGVGLYLFIKRQRAGK